MPPIKAILFLAGLTIAIVVIVAELVFSISNVLIPSKFSFNAKEHHAADELSATTGILFKGKKIRQYERFELIMVPLNLSFKFLREYKQENVQSCTKWAVVTTIFEPSPSVKAVAQSPSWCLVIVGDIKSPKSYNISGIKSDAKIDSAVIYLNEEDQVQLASFIPFVRELPWNHFGRKNVGYLYAIMHGAQIVWDFDDDNMLLQESILPSIVNPYFESIVHNTSIDVYEYESSFLSKTFGMSFNPYPMMGASNLPVWPRGLPLRHVKVSNDPEVLHHGVLRHSVLPLKDVAIVQSLANHDPDVDAIYRLTQPLPFSFQFPKSVMEAGSLQLSNSDHDRSTSSQVFIACPNQLFAPYNAQATLHMYDAFWALYLPISVHGRVSDIWRGYIFETVAKGTGLRLLFSSPIVAQYRNAHNYLADLQSESDLYHKTERLLLQLDSWEAELSQTGGIAHKFLEVYVRMYEHGYLDIKDMEMAKQWIQALSDAGYRFPDYRLTKL